MTWTPQGILNEKKLNQILAFIAEEEATSEANELRFIDTTALAAVDLNFNYVFHVSLYRRLSRANKRSLKTVCFVNEDHLAHYFQLHRLITDHSSLHVKIFRDRAEAAEWLGVPSEAIAGA